MLKLSSHRHRRLQGLLMLQANEDEARTGLVKEIRAYPRFGKTRSSQDLVDDWSETMWNLVALWCVILALGVVILCAHMYLRLVSEWQLSQRHYLVWQGILAALALGATLALLAIQETVGRAGENLDKGLEDVMALVRELAGWTRSALGWSETLRSEARACDGYSQQLRAVNASVSPLLATFEGTLEPLESYENHLAPVTNNARLGMLIFVIVPWLATLWCVVASRIGFRNRHSEGWAYSWTTTIQLPVALVVVASMVAVCVGVADFCFLGPAGALRADDASNNLVAYYLTCPSGQHPVRYAVANATSEIAKLRALNCSAGDDVEALLAADLMRLEVATDGCSDNYLRPAVRDVVYEDVCDAGLKALHAAFVAIMVVGFFGLVLVLPVATSQAEIVSDKAALDDCAEEDEETASSAHEDYQDTIQRTMNKSQSFRGPPYGDEAKTPIDDDDDASSLSSPRVMDRGPTESLHSTLSYLNIEVDGDSTEVVDDGDSEDEKYDAEQGLPARRVGRPASDKKVDFIVPPATI